MFLFRFPFFSLVYFWSKRALDSLYQLHCHQTYFLILLMFLGLKTFSNFFSLSSNKKSSLALNVPMRMRKLPSQHSLLFLNSVGCWKMENAFGKILSQRAARETIIMCFSTFNSLQGMQIVFVE